MPSTNIQKEWKEILTKVYQKANSDTKFRELCFKDPYAAIKQVSGKDIPKNVHVRFVDQSKELVFMLPAPNQSLTNEQLAAMAGGGSMGFADIGLLPSPPPR